MDELEETPSSEELQPPRRPPWRAFAVAASVIVLLLLAIFLPPLINLGKYRHSITASMSEALGRPVYVGGMQLRLLPLPGLVMSDFTVDEDPAFGYEPALHANSVVASLRLTSLWRGRLEVSRISLDEANLNLVRNSTGQWSIGSVLLRASQIPNAPTAQRHMSAHPRFPYIEATNARIDFKDGPEKKPFSLMNAEFSMWQAGGDEWRLRLQAQPARTDLELHLSDTGQVTVEGSLHRAPDLNAMPVDLRADWTGAQLGQVSRLVTGIDSGWRGDLNISSTIRGSVADLSIQSRVAIADLRRQEFQPSSTVELDATCRGEYHRVQRIFDSIVCFSALSGGHFLLTGSVQGFAAPKADLQLEINQIPVSFPVTMLGLLRPAAQNVTATGTINGGFHFTTGGHPALSGDATTTALALHYSGGQLTIPPMHFLATPPPPASPRGRSRQPPVPAPAVVNAIRLLPVAIPLGQLQPVVADAQFTRAGFELHLSGSATLVRLIPAVSNLGLLENALNLVAPKGNVALNLATTGAWMRPLSGAASGLVTTGTLRVENAELQPAFLLAPVEVQSAQILLTPDQVSWQEVAFRYRGMALRGSIQFPASCNQPVACSAAFSLESASLDAAAMETGLAGNSGFLGHLLTSAFGGTSPWPPMRGQLRCDAFRLGQLELRNLDAALSVEGSSLTLSFLNAAAFGGTLHATGAMKIQDGTPHWNLKLQATNAGAPEIAALFGEKWGPGRLNAEANLTLSGYRAEDLESSAAGDFSFNWENGSMPAGEGLTEAALGHFDRWEAKGTIAKSALTLTGGGISRAARTAAVRGDISFSRDLNLTLETHRGPLRIAGTLAQPVINTELSP
jgi:hypothetical protein